MHSTNAYFESKLKSAHTFLSRWNGARAEMWEMRGPHKSLRVLVRRKGVAGNLLLACLDPITIKGPVRWDHCDLRVTTTTLSPTRETGFLVADQLAGVEIICGALEVKENVKV